MSALLLALLARAWAVPVDALGITLDIPATAQPSGSSGSTAVWRDPSDGTVWSVERRGDGTGAALPITLAQAARMVPDAMGAGWTDAPVATRLGGVEAMRIRYGVGVREARTWALLSNGYLYAVTIVAPSESLESRAAHLLATARVPVGTVMTKAPLDLTQLGLALPGAADLPVATIAGAVPAVAMLDAPARAGLILARLPAATSAFAGKDAPGVAGVLTREGCTGVQAKPTTFGGVAATEARCTRADGKGGTNVERVLVVQKGAAVWVLRATTDSERADTLDAWAERRLAGGRVTW